MQFTDSALKAALEATALTHRQAVHNLANMDTPGFVSQQTDFRALLLEKKLPHGPAFEAYLQDVGSRAPRIEIEAELARMSRAGMEHAALVQLVNSRYSVLRLAATEGRR